MRFELLDFDSALGDRILCKCVSWTIFDSFDSQRGCGTYVRVMFPLLPTGTCTAFSRRNGTAALERQRPILQPKQVYLL